MFCLWNMVQLVTLWHSTKQSRIVPQKHIIQNRLLEFYEKNQLEMRIYGMKKNDNDMI